MDGGLVEKKAWYATKTHNYLALLLIFRRVKNVTSSRVPE